MQNLDNTKPFCDNMIPTYEFIMHNKEKSKYFLVYYQNDPMKIRMSKGQLEKYTDVYMKTKEKLEKESSDTFKKFVIAWIKDAHTETATIGPEFTLAVSEHFNTMGKIFDYDDWFIEGAVYDATYDVISHNTDGLFFELYDLLNKNQWIQRNIMNPRSKIDKSKSL